MSPPLIGNNKTFCNAIVNIRAAIADRAVHNLYCAFAVSGWQNTVHLFSGASTDSENNKNTTLQ